MAWNQSVTFMPDDWSQMIVFKDPAKDDKLGFIDTIKRGQTFRIVGASDKPIVLKAVRTPWDCYSVAECLGKGRGKLTARIQLNEDLWKSLHSLDETFKSFLIRHRNKLFSSMDAEFIGRDNSAIALKVSKPLAPTGPSGEPNYDAFITVRISGRAGEIEELTFKDGAAGKYVSSIKWAPRSAPLAANATRFSLVTGKLENGKPIIRDTLPIEGGVPVGGQHMRYPGPGDIGANAVLRYATLHPSYWSLQPGGGASITLVLDSAVVENLVDIDEALAQTVARPQAPEGFVLYSDVGSAVSNAGAGAGGEPFPSRPPVSESKRPRVEVPLPPVARSNTGGGAPLRRGNAIAGGFFSRSSSLTAGPAAAGGGGGGGGPTAVALLAGNHATEPMHSDEYILHMMEQQREYLARIAEEHDDMKRGSAVPPYECSQMPPSDLPEDTE